MKVNVRILQEISKQGYIKQFALYFFIKQLTRKGKIYNFNPNRLAKLTGIHHKTADKYSKKLLNLGLAKIHHDNFCLVSQKHLTEKKLYWKINEGTYKHILNQLNSMVIRAAYNQQLHNVAKKSYPNCKSNKLIRKIALKKAKYNIYFSSRSIAKLFSVSHSKTIEILNKLRNDKILNFHWNIKFIKKARFSEFKVLNSFDNKNYYFYKGGCIYQHCGVILEWWG